MCGDICISDGSARRFQQALDQVVTLTPRQRHGIGMQMEKTLHAVLKAYEDPDEDHQEIPIGSYIADIYREDEQSITEIQTANLGYLRPKLAEFLEQYKVTVVYPIAARKWITWINPETGETEKRNRSPKKGTYYHAFRELYKIRPYLSDPNLRIKLILLEIEEYRIRDGWGRGGKRGSHRYDAVPTKILGETLLTRPEDYMQFIPYPLDEPFTSAQLAKACGAGKQSFSTAALLLTELGVIDRIGKKGNAYLYRVSR